MAIAVAVFNQTNAAAACRFRRGVVMEKTRGAAGEASVGDQRAGLPSPLISGSWLGRAFPACRGAAFPGLRNGSPAHRQRLNFAAEESLLPRRHGFHYAFAGPVNLRMLSSTPAVLTMQPFSAKLPYSTAKAAVFAVGVFQRTDAAISRDRHREESPTAILRECSGGTNARRASAEHIFTARHPQVSITSYCWHLQQRQAKYIFTSRFSNPLTISSPRIPITPPAR